MSIERRRSNVEAGGGGLCSREGLAPGCRLLYRISLCSGAPAPVAGPFPPRVWLQNLRPPGAHPTPRSDMIPVSRPSIGEAELSAVGRVFETGWLGMGSEVER